MLTAGFRRLKTEVSASWVKSRRVSAAPASQEGDRNMDEKSQAIHPAAGGPGTVLEEMGGGQESDWTRLAGTTAQ